MLTFKAGVLSGALSLWWLPVATVPEVPGRCILSPLCLGSLGEESVVWDAKCGDSQGSKLWTTQTLYHGDAVQSASGRSCWGLGVLRAACVGHCWVQMSLLREGIHAKVWMAAFAFLELSHCWSHHRPAPEVELGEVVSSLRRRRDGICTLSGPQCSCAWSPLGNPCRGRLWSGGSRWSPFLTDMPRWCRWCWSKMSSKSLKQTTMINPARTFWTQSGTPVPLSAMTHRCGSPKGTPTCLRPPRNLGYQWLFLRRLVLPREGKGFLEKMQWYTCASSDKNNLIMCQMKPSVWCSASFLPPYFPGKLCLLGGPQGTETVQVFVFLVGSDPIVRPAECGKSTPDQVLGSRNTPQFCLLVYHTEDKSLLLKK